MDAIAGSIVKTEEKRHAVVPLAAIGSRIILLIRISLEGLWRIARRPQVSHALVGQRCAPKETPAMAMAGSSV